jgi:hypothetical protein
MEHLIHHGDMFGLVLIPVLALVALAVYAYGADSRIDDVDRRRRFNG